jgi:hypothetical protein
MAIRNAILGGKRPRRPMLAGAVGLSGQLWEYITTAWSEIPTYRPPLGEIRNCLNSVDCAVSLLRWPGQSGQFTGMHSYIDYNPVLIGLSHQLRSWGEYIHGSRLAQLRLVTD